VELDNVQKAGLLRGAVGFVFGFGLGLGDDVVADVFRRWGAVAEFHGELAAAGGHSAQVADVADFFWFFRDIAVELHDRVDCLTKQVKYSSSHG